MVTLHASALLENIETSLTAYLTATLVTTEALAVHFPVEDDFVPVARWVSVSYGLLDALADYGGVLTQTERVDRRRGFLELTLVEQRILRTDIYALAHMRDQVLRHVSHGQAVPVRDYQAVGTPIVGYVHCGAHTGREIDTGYVSGRRQYSLSVPVHFLERRS